MKLVEWKSFYFFFKFDWSFVQGWFRRFFFLRENTLLHQIFKFQQNAFHMIRLVPIQTANINVSAEVIFLLYAFKMFIQSGRGYV